MSTYGEVRQHVSDAVDALSEAIEAYDRIAAVSDIGTDGRKQRATLAEIRARLNDMT